MLYLVSAVKIKLGLCRMNFLAVFAVTDKNLHIAIESLVCDDIDGPSVHSVTCLLGTRSVSLRPKANDNNVRAASNVLIILTFVQNPATGGWNRIAQNP